MRDRLREFWELTLFQKGVTPGNSSEKGQKSQLLRLRLQESVQPYVINQNIRLGSVSATETCETFPNASSNTSISNCVNCEPSDWDGRRRRFGKGPSADGNKEARDVPKEPITRKKGRPATGKVTGGNYCSAVGCSNCTVRDRKKGVKFTMHFWNKKPENILHSTCMQLCHMWVGKCVLCCFALADRRIRAGTRTLWHIIERHFI